MTPKQLRLLCNLADGPSIASTLTKGVVPYFKCISDYTPAHVVGSMLKTLSTLGYCYSIPIRKKSCKLWHITELGFNQMLQEFSSPDN